METLGCNLAVTSIMDKMEVKCANSTTGDSHSSSCEWRGPLERFEAHCADECGDVQLECPNSARGCNERMLRKRIAMHRLDCSHELVACVECGEGIERVNMHRHMRECPAVAVACVHGCGVLHARRDAALHAEDCPEVLMACPYSEHGCAVVGLRRKDYAAHQEASVVRHMELLQGQTDQANQLKLRVATLERENTQLQQETLQVKTHSIQLNKDIVHLMDVTVQMRSDNDRLNRETILLREDFNHISQENSHLNEATSRLKADNSQLKQETAPLKEDNIQLRKQIDSLRQEVGRMSYLIDELSQDNAHIRQEVASVSHATEVKMSWTYELRERVQISKSRKVYLSGYGEYEVCLKASRKDDYLALFVCAKGDYFPLVVGGTELVCGDTFAILNANSSINKTSSGQGYSKFLPWEEATTLTEDRKIKISATIKLRIPDGEDSLRV